MLRRALLMLALLGLASPVMAETWTIDPNNSEALFVVRHRGVNFVHGFFHKITGTVDFDAGDVRRSMVDVTIDVSTVDTGVAPRDEHLRSADFFEVERYPVMTFTSKRVEPASPGRFRLVGDFTLKGVTKEIVLDITQPASPVSLREGVWVSGASATTTINRRDFGVSYGGFLAGGVPDIGDQVDITINLELQRTTETSE
ncbi:MAG: YceI family protein [Acidobacteria bacterium]|nr:YceI family protein [Acidobacteriota bacterium]